MPVNQAEVTDREGVPHESDGKPVRTEARSSKDPGPVATCYQASAIAGDILRDRVSHKWPAARPILVLHILFLVITRQPGKAHR